MEFLKLDNKISVDTLDMIKSTPGILFKNKFQSGYKLFKEIFYPVYLMHLSCDTHIISISFSKIPTVKFRINNSVREKNTFFFFFSPFLAWIVDNEEKKGRD